MFQWKGWRRFRPKSINRGQTTDPFLVAEHKLNKLLPRHPRVDRIGKIIEQLKYDAEHGGTASDWLAYLIVQVPRAALAQIQMDKYPRGYHNRSARLYELIDFNDAYVAAVMALDDVSRARFHERAKQAADQMCKRTNTTKFSDEQWDSINRGLSREIAIFRAAISSGFEAYMTSRTQDALGIDMQIRDPETGRYVNIDCKSPSAFRYRLEDLVRERRLSTRELYAADERGYVLQNNGRGSEKSEVIVIAIPQETYGKIIDFEFINTDPIRHKINQLIRDHGLSDNRYGLY